MPFFADLVRAVSLMAMVDFMALSAYAPKSGRVRILKDLDIDVTGADVVVVAEIVETGLTLSYLMSQLASRGPRSVSACALFDRPARRLVPVPIRFRGMEVGEQYLIGYGLGHGERYRDLETVMVVDPSDLSLYADEATARLYPAFEGTR